ncbi:MAG: ATP-binding protein [Bacteroidia bacterium]|nr:ATP-binding protein [Bacteroidia bacterium]MCB9236139.1 ATP-binding protein [Bacteroidia bacterium]
MKKFDLNIEKILENWETFHAIRELISNALDEQLLTKTKEVKIYKNEGAWFIRDFGRGLQYTHLTQNENQEKLKNSNVIGKFGIGLKDALATFDRKGITVLAHSKHSQITISKSAKEGFGDIITLHAIINEPRDKNFIGTEFELIGVSDKDIEEAKNLFLKFSGENVLETTRQGQVIEKKGKNGNIYINGVKVAEEENFLFSYNITVLNASIKKALNRERTNVGRSAYTDSVKKILLASQSRNVAENLARDLTNIARGMAHDELSWIDVQEHSVKILNRQGKYLFVTAFEGMQYPDMIDQARISGHQIITIPDNLKFKIQGSTDHSGNPIVDIGQFVSNYNDSFDFNFIEIGDLTNQEKEIYDLLPLIIDLFGGQPRKVKSIRISTTMRKDLFSNVETMGCWDENSSSIVLSRKTLKSIEEFSGILIHELIHAKTGLDDVTRAFETELTKTIGHLCRHYFNRKNGVEMN